MVQSPSWAANWFAVSQEIPRISRNPKVHYRTHKRKDLSPEQASHVWVFLNNDFYREGLLAPRPTPKLEDHPSSAVRDCLFNLFPATLLICLQPEAAPCRGDRDPLTHWIICHV